MRWLATAAVIYALVTIAVGHYTIVLSFKANQVVQVGKRYFFIQELLPDQATAITNMKRRAK